MDTPATTDEGEPARINFKLHFSILIFAAVTLITVSCNQPEKETVKKPVAVDSIVIKQQQHTADSAKNANPLVITKKKIYLTFDDGPNKGTMNVLNAVKEDSIPASFFIVGTHTDDSPAQQETWELLKADSSIELCNHSYTHAANHYSKFYQHPDEVIKDFEKNKEELGFKNNIIRTPGRNAWRIDTVNHTDIKESEAAVDSVYAAGFDVMGWDVEWTFDHKTLAPDTATGLLLRRIENMLDADKTRTKGHLVLLAHDQAFCTEAAVEQLHFLFRELKNNPEYELELAANYPGIRKIY